MVLLRCLNVIGWDSPLKHQYLDQVEKKVRGKPSSSLSAAPSLLPEDFFEHFCLIFFPFTESPRK